MHGSGPNLKDDEGFFFLFLDFKQNRYYVEWMGDESNNFTFEYSYTDITDV